MLHCYLPKESPTLRESMMGKIKEKREEYYLLVASIVSVLART